MKCKIIALMCIIPLCLLAQEKDFSSLPGNARFQDLKNLRSYGKVTEINLDENLFSMIDYDNMKDGRELKKLLRPIKGIVLYSIDDIKKVMADSLKQTFAVIDSALSKDGWKKLIATDDGNELTSVYVRYSEENRIVGLAITSLSGGKRKYKADLVNIIGDIDMNTIGKVGRKFKLPALGKDENADNYENDENDE